MSAIVEMKGKFIYTPFRCVYKSTLQGKAVVFTVFEDAGADLSDGNIYLLNWGETRGLEQSEKYWLFIDVFNPAGNTNTGMEATVDLSHKKTTRQQVTHDVTKPL